MLKEFKAFIERGNAIEMAVGIVMGSAFTAVVNSIVNDIIMPLIGAIMGGVDFSSLAFKIGEATFAYGNLIQAIINFLLISLVLFFIVKGFNQASKASEEALAKAKEKLGIKVAEAVAEKKEEEK